MKYVPVPGASGQIVRHVIDPLADNMVVVQTQFVPQPAKIQKPNPAHRPAHHGGCSGSGRA